MTYALPVWPQEQEAAICGHPAEGDPFNHPTPASTCPPALTRECVIDGLYIHVPFCFHKCHYCDFYSIVDPSRPGRPDRQEMFTDRLVDELTHRANRVGLQPRTIFVGGGTPTLLRPRLWANLLETMIRAGHLERVEEFTVEANPETVTGQLLDVLVQGGVNRISIGAQSFEPRMLQALERWHDPANVGRAVDLARAAGITNINLDLIFAIPGQTLAMLDADLDAALALEPQHISYYGLTYEPNTALTGRRQAGGVTPIDEDLETRMYIRAMERLGAAGYGHYEVSNWARPGRRCSHNMTYWLNGNWLGIGPAAASHVDGYRWKNVPNLGRYLSQQPEPPTVEHERLGQIEGVGEQLMLRLRLREGVQRQWLEDHLPPGDARHETIDELIGLTLFERTETHLRLTPRGLLVADTVIARLL